MTNRVVPIISKFHEFLMISFLMKTPLPSSKVDTIFGFFCFPFLCRFFFASLFLQQILEKSRFHLSFRFAFLFFTGWTNCRRWLFVSFCLFVFWWFCRRCWTTTTKAFRGRASATWWRTGRCCVVRSCRGPPSSSPPTTTSSSSSPRSTRRPSSTGSSKTSAAPSKRWVWLCGCVRAPGPRPFLFFSPPFLFPDFPSCCERFDVQRRLLLLLLSAVWTLCWVRWFVFFLALATQLSDDMTEFYTINSEYALARHDLYLGQVLAVEYVDRVWYRGRIAGFPGDQKVTPFFCFVFFFISLFLFFWLCSFFFVPTLRIRFSASP